MTKKEIKERGFTTDKDGRVIDDFGNEYRNEEGMVEYVENEPKLIIHQPKIRGCDDSFFYEGLIAETDKAEMIAVGEIRAWSFEDKFYTENTSDLIDEYPDDKKLVKAIKKAERSAKITDFFGLNNWFEVIEKKEDVGYVCYSYKEALNHLKSL